MNMDKRVIFLHEPKKKRLNISVPKALATDELVKDMRTATHVKLEIWAPSPECPLPLVVRFEDGSETPFTISGTPDDFMNAHDDGTMSVVIPTRNTLETCVANIYDPDMVVPPEKIDDLGKIDPAILKELRDKYIIWSGSASTNIRKRGDGYADGNRVIIITSPRR
jgi:hypothetical protein